MPRGKPRRTQTGEDAQNIRSVPGQRYGEGVQQQQLQQAMPAPDRSGAPSAVVTESAPAAASPRAAGPATPEQLQQYLATQRPNLFAGSQRPDEPITTGLASGPGAGPEALRGRPNTPIARFFERLTAETGDPRWARIARQARL